MNTATIQPLPEHEVGSVTSHQQSRHHLCIQIKHNLKYQHSWTNVRIHTRSPNTGDYLERPMISGLPPARLYIHPDEQIELIKAQRSQASRTEKGTLDEGASKHTQTKSGLISNSGQVFASPEREWILPVHIREKWSLSRMAAVFDAISSIPPELNELSSVQTSDNSEGTWRKTKRLAMAIVSDDSTVVYYIVHDGLVKPRQN